jgi:hypothetical protein
MENSCSHNTDEIERSRAPRYPPLHHRKSTRLNRRDVSCWGRRSKAQPQHNPNANCSNRSINPSRDSAIFVPVGHIAECNPYAKPLPFVKCESTVEFSNRPTTQLLAAMKGGEAQVLTKDKLPERIAAPRQGPAPVVALRIPQADPDLARKQAEEKDLPYQTYIKSLLHETLVDRERRNAQPALRSLVSTPRGWTRMASGRMKSPFDRRFDAPRDIPETIGNNNEFHERATSLGRTRVCDMKVGIGDLAEKPVPPERMSTQGCGRCGYQPRSSPGAIRNAAGSRISIRKIRSTHHWDLNFHVAVDYFLVDLLDR